MAGAGKKLTSFLWWTYPRGGLEYDIMVGLILAFIFFTPRHFFRDTPRPLSEPFESDDSQMVPAQLSNSALLIAAGWQESALTLDQVLANLNQAGPKVTSFTAAVEQVYHEQVSNEDTVSNGQLYFKKSSGGPMYAEYFTDARNPHLDVTLIYKGGMMWKIQPAIKEALVYDAKARSDVQAMVGSFLLLGIGGTGSDLQKAYHAEVGTTLVLNGTPALELKLKPRDPGIARSVSEVDVWYDTHTWVAARLRYTQADGDIYIDTYSNSKVNPGIDDSRFEARLSGYTVSHH